MRARRHKLTSPDGENVFSYNTRGQLEGVTLSVSGANTLLEGKLGYDEFARVATITYPTPAGAAPFVITQDFDRFGHVLKVHDAVTDYWRLTDSIPGESKRAATAHPSSTQMVRVLRRRFRPTAPTRLPLRAGHSPKARPTRRG